MSGTKIGGIKASRTNKARYGADFYELVGRYGGKRKVKKGFAMMSPEIHKEISAKGGQKSRRGKVK